MKFAFTNEPVMFHGLKKTCIKTSYCYTVYGNTVCSFHKKRFLPDEDMPQKTTPGPQQSGQHTSLFECQCELH